MAKSSTEDDFFFDAFEEISSGSDCASEGSESCTSSELRRLGDVLSSFRQDLWTGNPKSVDERRDEFIRQTGFVIERCHTAREGPDDTILEHFDATVGASGRGMRTLGYDGKDLTVEIQTQTHEAVNERDDLLGRIKRLDSVDLDVDDVDPNEMPKQLHDHEAGIDRWLSVEEFRRTFDSSNLVRHLMRRELKEKGDTTDLRKQSCDGSWLKRFSDKATTMFKKQRVNKNLYDYEMVTGANSQRVHVRSHKKWSKELSSLFRKQNFYAHQCSILAMKFSLDGQHLATGAEDGTLLVWKVIEDDSSTDFDILNISPTSACLYFSVNGISNLASFHKIKEEGNMLDKLKRLSESASIMVPQKIFRIIEKPLHVLSGHEGEILDISWSKRGQLLSSSVDKTVRLWEVGSDSCLRVFPHSDYVTCAQFNPIDDSYFISGSIDGIVRIWEVHGCQVVDWIEIKEIVTAICYNPNGKGGIVGSMIGNCCFFEITGSLQPGSAIYLRSKKNITCKRITGFQFCPSDPREVVVSSAESQVRLLRGTDVIRKFRGSLRLADLHHGGSQIFASFTADGRHIISATDDSNVYMWNTINDKKISNCKAKNVWCCESFSSQNALIAVPWHGIRSVSGKHSGPRPSHESPVHFHSLNHSPTTSVMPGMNNIDYGLLRSACESILSDSHLWGLVIVTGGADGRIRTYHNYGLPVRYPGDKSLKSSFSLSSLIKKVH